MGTTDLASTFTGTPYYMSPEVLKHEGSIGCILYEMCALDHAFDGKSLMAVIMLNKDPEKRPSATELIKVPLLSGHIAKMSEEKEKSRLEDLRKTEDETKMRNLHPRERMRLKKLREADKEAQRLSEVARVQLIENQERKSRIQETLFKPSIPAWQGGHGEGGDLKTALTVKGVSARKQPKDFGTRSAPSVSEDQSSDEDQEQTVIHKPLKTAGGPSLSQYLPKASSDDPDDRAITPLKDKMVYDRLYSSLDFKDGIPDNPALANTYYSQFDEDFTPSDDEDEAAETVIRRKNDDSDDDDDILFGSKDGTLKKDEEEDFFNQLHECEKMLGQAGFDKAYNYLKTARYDRATEATEEDIMSGLRDFVKNPREF
ncbi:NEK11-like protein [Mya arenaria]|uniref:non-specific serine/threonine protein kinase n=1 Tax=Mya arenaria TaxID=6604 RepID=A0ABY7ERE6_MYAAR|nr:NEK11-like protein [Mya arenaria]